jgi:hypothetical protein
VAVNAVWAPSQQTRHPNLPANAQVDGLGTTPADAAPQRCSRLPGARPAARTHVAGRRPTPPSWATLLVQVGHSPARSYRAPALVAILLHPRLSQDLPHHGSWPNGMMRCSLGRQPSQQDTNPVTWPLEKGKEAHAALLLLIGSLLLLPAS